MNHRLILSPKKTELVLITKKQIETIMPIQVDSQIIIQTKEDAMCLGITIMNIETNGTKHKVPS